MQRHHNDTTLTFSCVLLSPPLSAPLCTQSRAEVVCSQEKPGTGEEAAVWLLQGNHGDLAPGQPALFFSPCERAEIPPIHVPVSNLKSTEKCVCGGVFSRGRGVSGEREGTAARRRSYRTACGRNTSSHLRGMFGAPFSSPPRE